MEADEGESRPTAFMSEPYRALLVGRLEEGRQLLEELRQIISECELDVYLLQDSAHGRLIDRWHESERQGTSSSSYLALFVGNTGRKPLASCATDS